MKKVGKLERVGLIGKQIDKNKLARKEAKKHAKEKRNGARAAARSKLVCVLTEPPKAAMLSPFRIDVLTSIVLHRRTLPKESRGTTRRNRRE